MCGLIRGGLLVLDWQGTLWDPVKHRPIEGAAGALARLGEHWRIVVASNGDASDIEAQLEEVGLRELCRSVYTPRVVGAAKPATAFYRALLRREGVPPDQAAMLGDDYRRDVAGAKAQGLRAIWFNPSRRGPPLRHPVHDSEVADLRALPHVLAAAFLPDLARCLGLLVEAGLPPRAIRHALAVSAVAHRLALMQRDRGLAVDPLLAHRGGLLHDLDKVSTATRPAEHGREGGRALRAQGLEVLARIAERHVFDATCGAQCADWTWEECDVFYADKVVREDELVGLEPRMADLAHRYPAYAETLARWRPALDRMEARLATSVGMERAAMLQKLHEVLP